MTDNHPDLEFVTTQELFDEVRKRYRDAVFGGIPMNDEESADYRSWGSWATGVGLAKIIEQGILQRVKNRPE